MTKRRIFKLWELNSWWRASRDINDAEKKAKLTWVRKGSFLLPVDCQKKWPVGWHAVDQRENPVKKAFWRPESTVNHFETPGWDFPPPPFLIPSHLQTPLIRLLVLHTRIPSRTSLRSIQGQLDCFRCHMSWGRFSLVWFLSKRNLGTFAFFPWGDNGSRCSVVARFLRCSAIYYEKGHKCSGFCLFVC